MKNKIPCVFYLYMHSKIKNYLYKNGRISIKDLESKMFEWRIPKNIRPLIVKEMEMLNLIKKINKKEVIFIKSNFDINNISYLCSNLKIY